MIFDTATLKGIIPTGHKKIKTDVIPVDATLDQLTMCQKLKTMLDEFGNRKLKAADTSADCEDENAQRWEFWDIAFCMGVAKLTTSFLSLLSGNVHQSGFVQLAPLGITHCLEAIRDLSDSEARVKVDMTIDHLGSTRAGYKLETVEMNINKNQHARCHDYVTIKYPLDVANQSLKANISIIVTVPEDILARHRELSPASIPLTRKILENEILTDVILIPECGTQIKAHKAILACHSSVFLTMFQTDMSESKESIVEVPDMCEDSVRALLKYCYYEDMKAAEESSTVCFALYTAAHKYDIEPLETKTREILVSKESSFEAGWWDVDVAVKLFHFLRKLTPCDEELKMKTVQVLKTCPGELEDSSSYLELFETDAKAAMELCQYALTMHTR